jgi:hypothetical protein
MFRAKARAGFALADGETPSEERERAWFLLMLRTSPAQVFGPV